MTDEDVQKVVAQIQAAMRPTDEKAEEPRAESPAPAGLVEIRHPCYGRTMSDFALDMGRAAQTWGEIYLRNGTPVTLDCHQTRLVEVDPDSFRTLAEKFARIVKMDTREERMRAISLSRDCARAVLKAPVFLSQIPSVRGLASVPMPFCGDDGLIRLLLAKDAPKYDAEAQIVSLPGMTLDEMTIEESRAVIDELLAAFPFADEGRSKAVQVAAMLSVYGLGLLSRSAQVPVFIYTANSPRSGKTLLAKAAIIPTVGFAAVRTLSGDDEELRKALDASVHDGSRYLFLDNIKRKITSPALESFCTGAAWAGRKLGKGEGFEAEKQMVVFITANHAQVSTDMAGRALFVDLWVQDANPQARQFKTVIDDAYLSRKDVRQRLLSGLWGLVRHWDKQGRPRPDASLVGFHEWSRVIGGIVIAAGFGDPLAAPEMDAAGDGESADVHALLKIIILGNVPDEGFSFGDLADIAVREGLFGLQDSENGNLSPADRSRFGKLLARWSQTPARSSVEGRRHQIDGKSVYFRLFGKGHGRRYKVKVC